ncbi:MAG: HAMP domain-containing sensor histidine kinase, partial [Nitrospirota bacterium]
MFKFQPSIRQKITFGYYAGVIVIVGLFIFSLLTLRFIEKKIIFGEVVSELFDTILEIRRFEKNFLLYEQDSDYRENMNYLSKAQKILKDHMEEYKTLVVSKQLKTMQNALKEYEQTMTLFALSGKQDADRKARLELTIREKGKEITTFAENISKAERERIRLLISKTRRNLIFLITFLSLTGITIGQVLSRMVVRPLKSLEETMKEIAEGRFKNVSINSKDREVVSLADAINKMLKELESRRRHLVQSEKLASLGTLLSGVAHELNNPLSNIYSSSQILMEEIEEADPEYKKELLSQIDEQAERAKNIVRSLLEFSRAKEFKKETLPLRKLFEDTITFVRGQVPAMVDIKLDIPEDMIIFADKQRIQQVFLNLIKNAIEAIPEEGSVFISARKHQAIYKKEEETGCPVEENAVDIEIRDTGIGIPSEVLPKIFDPFYTTKDVGKGSGLGLFLVYEIIEEHDGCISVSSEVGKGTTFLISL